MAWPSDGDTFTEELLVHPHVKDPHLNKRRFAAVATLIALLFTALPVSLSSRAPFIRLNTAHVYAAGGPVILDGTDAGYHGSVSNGVPQGQWIYVKKAYQNLISGVSASYASASNGRIAVVGAPQSGSTSDNISNNCGGAAYWGAYTQSPSVSVDFYDGATAIESFFNNVQSGAVKPLLIHIVDSVCNTNRMDSAEYAKVNAAANAIATHVNRGGALFANTAITATSAGSPNYGWLSALFPTLTAASGGGSALQLTADGQTAFPGLTNANIAGAWHNKFTDSSGTFPLTILATEAGQNGIIGGASVTLPSAVTITPTPSGSTTGNQICFVVNVKRGNPLANFSGATVTFSVTGANAGASLASASTDASGNTPSRCYTGNNAGTDTVTATAVNPSDSSNLGEGVSNVVWTALTATASTATISPSQNATVQGSVTGTMYLVNTSVSVSNLASITGAAGNLWNSVTISSANTNTSLAATGLVSGTYKAYLADGPGNLSPASTNTVTVDADAPTVTITRSGSGTVGGGQSITITFTLSKSSSNFAAGDVTVSSGTLSGFAGSGTTYTATWTPAASGSGTAGISVAAGTFTDSLSNDNAASSTFSIVWNANLPSVTITRAGSGTVGGGQDITITFELSEASTNFTAADVTVSSGTLTGFAGSGTTYTATWTPAASGSGMASISVAANRFTDSAGNNNTASTALSIVWNANLPSVNITRSGTGTVGIGQTITLTFELSEISVNFTAADITVSAGTISGFTGSGTNYTAVWTPPASATGTASVSVAAAKFTDSAGNNNTASTTLSISYDTAPVVTTTDPSMAASNNTVPTGVSTPVVTTTVPKRPAVKGSVTRPATTVPVTTTTTSTIPAPNAPQVEPGQAAAVIGGKKVSSVLTRQDNSILVTMGSLSALLTGYTNDGVKVPLDAEGNLRMKRNGRIGIEVNGFEPRSDLETWLFSTPVRLGKEMVSSNGSVSNEYSMPASVPQGRHRVVLSGVSPDGDDVEVAIAIIVGDDNATGPSVFSILLILVLALALVLGLALPATLRRLGAEVPGLRIGTRTARTVTVIDVRNASDFAFGHLDGALNITAGTGSFMDSVSELPKNGTYQIYGTGGATAAQQMRLAGYDDVRFLGEIAAAASATGRRIVS